MQTATNTSHSIHTGVLGLHGSDNGVATALNSFQQYQIIRRNGAVVPFEPNKIAVAMMKAFLAGARNARSGLSQREGNG
jgi:ribonucleoside-diphosphate reductase alpha chain